ncbi:MAG: hypothetical protein JNM63_03625 [Spirochaetia bacterium]|nr:hypothetical protein [Spirochaetia bacterium]
MRIVRPLVFLFGACLFLNAQAGSNEAELVRLIAAEPVEGRRYVDHVAFCLKAGQYKKAEALCKEYGEKLGDDFKGLVRQLSEDHARNHGEALEKLLGIPDDKTRFRALGIYYLKKKWLNRAVANLEAFVQNGGSLRDFKTQTVEAEDGTTLVCPEFWMVQAAKRGESMRFEANSLFGLSFNLDILSVDDNRASKEGIQRQRGLLERAATNMTLSGVFALSVEEVLSGSLTNLLNLTPAKSFQDEDAAIIWFTGKTLDQINQFVFLYVVPERNLPLFSKKVKYSQDFLNQNVASFVIQSPMHGGGRDFLANDFLAWLDSLVRRK